MIFADLCSDLSGSAIQKEHGDADSEEEAGGGEDDQLGHLSRLQLLQLGLVLEQSGILLVARRPALFLEAALFLLKLVLFLLHLNVLPFSLLLELVKLGLLLGLALGKRAL